MPATLMELLKKRDQGELGDSRLADAADLADLIAHATPSHVPTYDEAPPMQSGVVPKPRITDELSPPAGVFEDEAEPIVVPRSPAPVAVEAPQPTPPARKTERTDFVLIGVTAATLALSIVATVLLLMPK
jgi:hypothetical protein